MVAGILMLIVVFLYHGAARQSVSRCVSVLASPVFISSSMSSDVTSGHWVIIAGQ